eukprot:752763-Hanusia_phi.AAC.4
MATSDARIGPYGTLLANRVGHADCQLEDCRNPASRTWPGRPGHSARRGATVSAAAAYGVQGSGPG